MGTKMETVGKNRLRTVLMNLVWIPVAANLAGHWTGCHPLTVASKPLLMPLLALTAYLLMTGCGVRGAGRTKIVAALLFGALGDILLMFSGTWWFLAGMLSFLAGHVLYYLTLPSPFRFTVPSGPGVFSGTVPPSGEVASPAGDGDKCRRSPQRKVLSLLFLAGLLACVVYVAGLFPAEGAMKVAVTVYACAFAFLIHASVVAAFTASCTSRPATAVDVPGVPGKASPAALSSPALYLLTAAGFIVFAVSDAFVAIGAFTEAAIPRRGFIVMSTYIFAQMAVSLSLSLQEIKKTGKI